MIGPQALYPCHLPNREIFAGNAKTSTLRGSEIDKVGCLKGKGAS
jgi:hypothetical protein